MATLVTLQFRVLVKTDNVEDLRRKLDTRGKFALRAIHNCLNMGNIEIIGPKKDAPVFLTKIAVRETTDAAIVLL